MGAPDTPSPERPGDDRAVESAVAPLPDPHGPPQPLRDMEIHAPEHPVHTWREFFRHISIVTVGILIALSLEGLLEWRHHRHLAVEARENILREIEANLQSVRSVLAARESVERETGEVLAYVDDRAAHGRPLEMNFKVVSMSAAGWNSAQATGAVSYMDFSEVQEFAALYDVQQHFVTAQQQTLRDSALMGAAPHFEKASAMEFAAWRERIRIRQSSHAIEMRVAEILADLYQQVLAVHERSVEPREGSRTTDPTATGT